MFKKIMIVLKGFLIGGTMSIPGVSGGSMAMVLGIYDDLIISISTLFKRFKKNLLFLALFCAGALGGIVSFAKPLGMLLTNYEIPVMFFFIGAVVGSIPMIMRKAKVTAFSWRVLVYPVVGIIAVVLLSLLPTDLFGSENHGLGYYALLFAAGLITAVGLVLPGISVSQMLLMLGLYQPILNIIDTRDVPGLLSLSPLFIGLLLGILGTTKFLEAAMSRQPQITYLLVLGFLIGSVGQVFPGMPTGWEIPVCILLFGASFCAIFFLTRMEDRKDLADKARAAAATQEHAG